MGKANLFFPDMHLTAGDLRGDLNPERIQKIYLIFMQFLTGMTKEHLMQPSIDAQFVQEFPSIHEEANYKLKFSQFMNRICVAAAYDDFCLTDLIAPDKKTTMKILSALFNFCAHYEVRREKFLAIKDRQKAKVEQMQTMLAENDALRRKINDLKAEQVMQEEEESQLKGMNEKLGLECQRLTRESEASNQEISRLKENLSQAKARKASTESTLAGLRESSQQLSSQIVQSPDRMKREDARQLQNIEQLRIGVVEKTNRLSDVTQQAKAALDLLQEMERPLKQLKAVTETVAEHKLAQDELRALKEQSVDFQDKMEQLKQSEELIRRKLTARKERCHKQKLQDRNALESLKHEKICMDKKMSEQVSADSQVHSEVVALNQEIASLDARLKRKQVEHAKSMDQLKEKYMQIKKALDVYHQHWGNAYERNRKQ